MLCAAFVASIILTHKVGEQGEGAEGEEAAGEGALREGSVGATCPATL